MKNIKDYIIYLITLFFGLPFRVLPYRAGLFLGRGLGFFLYPFAKKHRRIAAENLQFAFPEKSEEWIKKTVFAHFLYLGEVIADGFYGERRGANFLKKQMIFDSATNELMDEILKVRSESKAAKGNPEKNTKKPRGIVLITAHFGLMEVAVWHTGFVLRSAGVYKPVKNKYIDRWYRRKREKSGIRLFSIDETQKIVRFVKEGGIIGIVPDQNAGPGGLFIDFLNRPASTFRGPALIAYLSGARIMFVSSLLTEDKKIRYTVKDLGYVDKSKFSDKEAAILHYTKLWVAELEEWVKKYPVQYFWVHRRWRTKPEDAIKNKT